MDEYKKMRNKRAPLQQRDYTYDDEKKRFFPKLDILVGAEKSKKPISLLADTGCTACIFLFKKHVEKEGLIFTKKMNIKPMPFLVADGHTINVDSYKAICEIDGEEKEIEVCVVDPEKIFEQDEEEPKIKIPPPVIGRGILDSYDVLFKGKERKIAVFHPE